MKSLVIVRDEIFGYCDISVAGKMHVWWWLRIDRAVVVQWWIMLLGFLGFQSIGGFFFLGAMIGEI